jgi:hypothetical protein
MVDLGRAIASIENAAAKKWIETNTGCAALTSEMSQFKLATLEK